MELLVAAAIGVMTAGGIYLVLRQRTFPAILGLALFQTNKGYGFVESLVYAFGAGAGFTLAKRTT